MAIYIHIYNFCKEKKTHVKSKQMAWKCQIPNPRRHKKSLKQQTPMCLILLFKRKIHWLRIRHRQKGAVAQAANTPCLCRPLPLQRCLQSSALTFCKRATFVLEQ